MRDRMDEPGSPISVPDRMRPARYRFMWPRLGHNHHATHPSTYTTDRSVVETARATPSSTGARERIVGTAYDLFCLHGIQAVGVDRIVAEAGVAKTTLYHHFRSK